jgi:3-dehydroquinate synthase
MQSLFIRSGQGDYSVEFHKQLDLLVQKIQEIPNSVLLIDRQVANLYSGALTRLLEKMPSHLIDANEDEKTLAGVTRVLNFLQETNSVKQTRVIAIGGGIIQDIASFSSHIYYRGAKWVFVPTTLLAMSDSCIGAKCGINFNTFKNQLGVFHSPSAVYICLPFLDTLTDTDIRSGYGEILKLMLTGSGELFQQLKKAFVRSGFRNPQLTELIYQSLKVKKQIIEEDEYEKDLRRILNFGHTFGHSLESITQHEIPHGLAVAWGVDIANFIAMRRGMLSEREFHFIHEVIEKHFRFPLSHKISVSALIQAARRDKKVADGKLTLILMEQPGKLHIVSTPFDPMLERVISEYLEFSHVLDRN